MRHPSLFDWGRIGTTAACVGEFRQRRYLLSRPLALALAAFLLFTSVMPTRLGNGRRDRRHQLDQSGHEVQQQSHVVHWQLTSSPWGMGALPGHARRAVGQVNSTSQTNRVEIARPQPMTVRYIQHRDRQGNRSPNVRPNDRGRFRGRSRLTVWCGPPASGAWGPLRWEPSS